jgi:hypothetical protein
MGLRGLTRGMGRISIVPKRQLAVLMLPYSAPAPIYANVHSRDLVMTRDLYSPLIVSWAFQTKDIVTLPVDAPIG